MLPDILLYSPVFQSVSSPIRVLLPWARYERIKRMVRHTETLPPVACNLLAGGLAGCTGVMLTYPADVVRTQLICGTPGDTRSAVQILQGVVQQRGIAGLYVE